MHTFFPVKARLTPDIGTHRGYHFSYLLENLGKDYSEEKQVQTFQKCPKLLSFLPKNYPPFDPDSYVAQNLKKKSARNSSITDLLIDKFTVFEKF